MSSAILKSFGWCGPSVKMICEVDSEFAAYLLNQSQADRQCLAYVVLGWERSRSSRMTPQDLGKAIRSQSKKMLLKQFLQPYPVGLVSVLSKLGNRIMVKDRYLELIDLLAEKNAAKFLWHEPTIRASMISALVKLEPPFRKSSIVRSVTSEAALHRVQYAIAVARKASPDCPNTMMAKSLDKKLSELQDQNLDTYEIKWVLQDWLIHRMGKITVPTPPWKGTHKLRPLTNRQEIIKTARDFSNCLAGEMAKIVGQKRYFYLWKDPAKKDQHSAVVALENEPLLGWIVGDIRGPNNKAISKNTKDKIIQEFRAAGIEQYPGARAFNFYD